MFHGCRFFVLRSGAWAEGVIADVTAASVGRVWLWRRCARAEDADPGLEQKVLQGCIADAVRRAACWQHERVFWHGRLATSGEGTAGSPALGHLAADVVLDC